MANKLLTSNNSKSLLPNKARIDYLFLRISSYVDGARRNIQRNIDLEMINAYWLIGRDIIKEEQYGKAKARYGEAILKTLSVKLTAKYPRGFSVDSLERMRKFYLLYQATSENQKSATLLRKSGMPRLLPNLSWSHYILLMKVTRVEARNFYAIEANKNNWSVRELSRQIGSLLFDRLAKSKNKEKLLALIQKGQEINSPEDAIKEPVVFEFLGLPESHLLVESKLEAALISNLQHFFLVKDLRL